jgi:hypothetical protein
MAIKAQYQPGEHVVVPLDSGAIVGKVIFCSLYFQDVVCVAFDAGSDGSTVTPQISFESPVFYTSGKALRKISKRIGMSTVSVEEGRLTRRLVADRIWILDCVEYPKTDPEPPNMDVIGYKLLLKRLNGIFSTREPEKKE